MIACKDPVEVVRKLCSKVAKESYRTTTDPDLSEYQTIASGLSARQPREPLRRRPAAPQPLEKGPECTLCRCALPDGAPGKSHVAHEI